MTQESLESATLGHAQSPAEAIPGYSAAITANGDITPVTPAPVSSQVGVDIPSSGQASSSTSPSQKCACLLCLGISTYDSTSVGTWHCRFASCNWGYKNPSTGFKWWMNLDRRKHEKTHYRLDPKLSQSTFSCPVENCRFSSKRWSDLLRHTSAKHCYNPAKFTCSVIGCKYNGEGNGFIRKDKLKDHYKNMHQGQRVPSQAVRAIEPASASSRVEASGSSSMGAQGE